MNFLYLTIDKSETEHTWLCLVYHSRWEVEHRNNQDQLIFAVTLRSAWIQLSF